MKYFFQNLCKTLTKHKYQKRIAWSEGIDPIGYYWQCKICRKRFWNYKSTVK